MAAKKQPAIGGLHSEGVGGDIIKGFAKKAVKLAKSATTSKTTKQAMQRAKIDATNARRMAEAERKRASEIADRLTERAFKNSATGRLHGDELMDIGRRAANYAKREYKGK
jgi:hypothetical protein